jgi:acid phosphatase
VFVVFDEGATSLRGGGRVPALALGTAVKPGARFAPTTGHYGLLRTIEEAWGLPLLGRSARAAPITGIWR